MQHSPVRSFIIWSWKDHLASGLIELTYPRLLLKKIITISSFHLKFKEVKTKRNYPKLSLFLNLIKLFYFIFKSPVAFAKAIYLASPINLLTHYAKGTPSLTILTSTAYRVTNSMSFSLIVYNTFSHVPLQYYSLSLNL